MSKYSLFFAAALITALPSLARAQCNIQDKAFGEMGPFNVDAGVTWSTVEILFRNDPPTATDGAADGGALPAKVADRDAINSPDTLPGGWPTDPKSYSEAWNAAAKRFVAESANCTVEDFLGTTNAQLGETLFDEPSAIAAAKAKVQQSQTSKANAATSPVLTALASPTGNIQAPKTLQFTATEVTTGGQQGYSPGVSGTPFAGLMGDNGGARFARHLNLSADTLIVTTPGAGTAAGGYSPAYIEGSIAYSSAITPYDITTELASTQVQDNAATVALRKSALDGIIRCIKGKDAKDYAKVLADCSKAPVKEFLGRDEDSYTTQMNEAVNQQNVYQFGVDMFFGRDLRYVPQLTDMDKITATGKDTYDIGAAKGFDLSISANLSLGASIPVPTSRVIWSGPLDPWTFKVTGSLGPVLKIPDGGLTPSPPSLAALVTGQEDGDNKSPAVGTQITLTVPVASGASFIAGVTGQCVHATACTWTPTFSFSAGTSSNGGSSGSSTSGGSGS